MEPQQHAELDAVLAAAAERGCYCGLWQTKPDSLEAHFPSPGRSFTLAPLLPWIAGAAVIAVVVLAILRGM